MFAIGQPYACFSTFAGHCCNNLVSLRRVGCVAEGLLTVQLCRLRKFILWATGLGIGSTNRQIAKGSLPTQLYTWKNIRI